MLLWLAISVLAALVCILIGWPMLRSRGAVEPTPERSDGIQEVYRDQLAEIAADLKRGLVEPHEAEVMRLELARRLLQQADHSGRIDHALPPAQSKLRSGAVLVATIVAVPAMALALYAILGSPQLAGRPFRPDAVAQAKASSATATDVEMLVAKVEERLRANPEDGRGWDVIAPVYLKLMRYEEARSAYARAIALLGETPKRLAGFADSAIRSSDGRVGDDARRAYEKVAAADPANVEARFWLAMAHEQHGDVGKALEGYRALLATAPAEAPWRAGVAERLAALAASSQVETSVAPERGPTASDVTAAFGMSEEARQKMISGMVDGLHARLKTDGKDAAGWQKLLRAYGVMGDLPKAQAALAEARKALADDKAGLGAVDALAKEMGLGS